MSDTPLSIPINGTAVTVITVDEHNRRMRELVRLNEELDARVAHVATCNEVQMARINELLDEQGRLQLQLSSMSESGGERLAERQRLVEEAQARVAELEREREVINTDLAIITETLHTKATEYDLCSKFDDAVELCNSGTRILKLGPRARKVQIDVTQCIDLMVPADMDLDVVIASIKSIFYSSLDSEGPSLLLRQHEIDGVEWNGRRPDIEVS